MTTKEVEARARIYGLNEVPETREHPLLSLLKKFAGLAAFTIEACIIIAVILGKVVEATVMAFLLVLNAIIGAGQEAKAGKAVALLKQKMSILAKVFRDGKWSIVQARELVPGDRVKLMLGDVVPADIQVNEGMLTVDQSALTGESLPVEKNPGETLYAGSHITRGDSIGTVQATGAKTFYGKTAQLIQVGKTRLIIEQITTTITKFLLTLDAAFIVIIAIVFAALGKNLTDVIPLLLALVIASVPVALPAMSAVTLSLGALDMAHEGVIVRSLNAVEAAAMMDIACLDKTGTITENRLTIMEVISLDPKYTKEEVLAFAVAASERVTSDPIDMAVVQYASTAGDLPKPSYEVIKLKPFDPRVKKSEATIARGGRTMKVAKGAPQAIAKDVANINNIQFNDLVNRLASDGKRALAISVQDGATRDMAGLIVFTDPPRADSAILITSLKELGIMIKMITGDNEPVARSIATRVGIGDRVRKVHEIPDFPGSASIKTVESTDVIAEVVPEDKFHIIDILQKTGHHVVGMTGDGVNDAPALHKADVGIAVSNATDVARSSAGIVLSKAGITNIVDLVRLGHSIYRKIIIWILNKIIKTFELVFFISLATILLQRPIIAPVQMLLILFLFDFVTISISLDKVSASTKPDQWHLRKLIALPLGIGTCNVVESFCALTLAAQFFGLSAGALQTFVFLMVFLSGLLMIISLREKRRFWASRPRIIFVAVILCDACFGTILAGFGILMDPISLGVIAFLVLYEFIMVFLINDKIKIVLERRAAK
nr:plasma-membrane proton-efflux P-type ATPase [Candidatus Sigynarchaeota archaeon]